MKRDSKVDLMRIIACAIVIGPHTYLPLIVNNNPDTSRGFFGGLVGAGVGVFLVINGVFVFLNKFFTIFLIFFSASSEVEKRAAPPRPPG